MNYSISCILLGNGDQTALSIRPFQFDKQRAVGISGSQIVLNHVMKTLCRKKYIRCIKINFQKDPTIFKL